jgi:hypothetical protein
MNAALQGITQLERALATATQLHARDNAAKENNFQFLQSQVERLEADVFDDFDSVGINDAPDENLHSEWKHAPSPLFLSPTPVKPPHVSHPDAPRPQQQFPPVIDHASELVMLQKQVQELSHRLMMIPTQQPGPSPPPTSHDATVAFLPIVKEIVNELKQFRNSDKVHLKSFCGTGSQIMEI